MTAFIYVRKSVVADDSTTLSPKVQEERCRALAAAHGDTDPEVLSDIGISGAKVEQRPAYMRLVAAIESGEATSVYSYDLSRLHRNTAEALRFFGIAEERKVPVRLVAESIDTSGPTGELMLTILAAMNAWVSKVTSAKIKASLKRRFDETGKKNGGRQYPHPEIVIEAYQQTGSLTRAARKLNADKVPTRNTQSRGWSASAVASIIQREAPDLIVPGESRGRPTARPFRFARLLRCSECGGRLSASYETKHEYTSYYCAVANTRPHGRKRVPESALAEAIQPEANRFLVRAKRVPLEGDPREAAKIDVLEGQVEQLAASGLDVTSLRADLEARRTALSPSRWVKRIALGELRLASDVGAGDPTAVNDFLRRVFDHVTVDMTADHERGKVSIIEAVWRDPSMRASDEGVEDTA